MTEISPPPVPAPAPAPDPRRRLRELLAIPERDRSDEQWDEIVELEISMAPGNRLDGPDVNVRRSGPMPGGDRNKPSGDRRPNGDRNNKPAGGGQRPAGGDRQRSGGPRPAGGAPRPAGDRRPAGPPRQGGDRRPASTANPGADAPAPVEQNDAGSAAGDQGAPAKKPFKKFHKRPPKATTPE